MAPHPTPGGHERRTQQEVAEERKARWRESTAAKKESFRCRPPRVRRRASLTRPPDRDLGHSVALEARVGRVRACPSTTRQGWVPRFLPERGALMRRTRAPSGRISAASPSRLRSSLTCVLRSRAPSAACTFACVDACDKTVPPRSPASPELAFLLQTKPALSTRRTKAALFLARQRRPLLCRTPLKGPLKGGAFQGQIEQLDSQAGEKEGDGSFRTVSRL